MQEAAVFWDDLWTRDAAELGVLEADLIELRSEALLSPALSPIDAADLENGLARLRKFAGVGVDIWSAQEWKELSLEAKAALLLLLRAIERHVALPLQSLLSIIALAPKTEGADAP